MPSLLFLKVERYGYENDEVRNEDLSTAVANKNVISKTDNDNYHVGAKEPSPALKPEEIAPMMMHTSHIEEQWYT